MGRVAMVMLLACCACSSSGNPEAASRGSLTTDTDSQSLPSKEQRLEFLARYLRSKSPIADAEFVIRYQDNSGGAIPGPSDWDIRAVFEVERQGAAWHEGWVACADGGASDARQSGPDMGWAQPLLDRRPQWRTLRSPPRCYRNPRTPASFVIIYEEDGIVLYRNTSERGVPTSP